MKVETFMQMSSIPYEIKATVNAHQGPQDKLPFILHQEKTVSDSQRIIEYLTSESSIHLDLHLTKEQLAMGHAIQVMLEERLR